MIIRGDNYPDTGGLMDKYTKARAAYPNARYHYIGHSHGTYLLAKALREYPAVSFHNVVFAGSVVEQDYEWSDYVEQDRVKRVLNFVATADWVVAFFPKALQSIGVQDLGSAGHDGFTSAYKIGEVREPERNIDVREPKKYITGGHSAALTELMWESISGFILTGKFTLPADVKKADDQSKWVSYPAVVAPLLWVIIACILGIILYFLFKLRLREWEKTLVITAYFVVIWTALTEI
jgi:pimeloyl-ACP methyl ester carboxylesterase